MSAPTENASRILLITLSNIGDALMTTPVMQALHEKYPRARMDIVCDPRSSELFAHCPYADRLIERDKQAGWRGAAALLGQLRQRRYGLIVDLRTDGLAWLLRAHRRLTRWGSRRSGGHAVERHMRVIMRREGITEIPPTRIWLDGGEDHQARQLLAGLPGPHRLALGPGANWGPKRWPARHFRDLTERFRDTFDAVVLLGSEADYPACREIADDLSLSCLNLAGKTGLLQAAAVLAQMRLFIGNDSGLGHLAAAAGIPTVTLFGPGEPERYHPWNPQGRWVQSPTGLIEGLSPTLVAEEVSALIGIHLR